MKLDRLPALGGASAVPAMLIPVDASVAVACFHCGLPLAGTDGLTVQIDGAARAMCCAGCRAVAQAIVGAGLESYYRHRQALPASAADTVPVELVQLALYDDPAVQSAFVRPVEDGADRGQSAPGRDEREAVLLIEGITCAACVWLVEGSLQRVAGVTGAQINYSTRRARIRWDQQRVALSSILQAVASVGYRACPFDAGRVDDLHRRERRRALAGLAIAGLGMMQVMMYAVPVYLAGADMAADTEQLMRWAGLVLTLPVLLYSAAPIFASAWRDLSGLRVGMDVPVALGIAVAFAASLQATLAGQGDVYFDSVTMFVFLLLAARFLESQVRARAARATDELARLIPAQAERLPSWTPQRRSLLPVAHRYAHQGHEHYRQPAGRPGQVGLLEVGHAESPLASGQDRIERGLERAARRRIAVARELGHCAYIGGKQQPIEQGGPPPLATASHRGRGGGV